MCVDPLPVSFNDQFPSLRGECSGCCSLPEALWVSLGAASPSAAPASPGGSACPRSSAGLPAHCQVFLVSNSSSPS